MKLVIVIEYDVNPEGCPILPAEAMEVLRERMLHPDLPNTKQRQVYAAIGGDADAVLSVFEALP